MSTALTLLSWTLLTVGLLLVMGYLMDHPNRKLRIGSMLLFFGLLTLEFSDPEPVIDAMHQYLDVAGVCKSC